MLKSMPKEMQERVVEHLREYVSDLQDELRWDTLHKLTQDKLVAAAGRADEEIAAGIAEPMDFERL